jgi:DNA-binding LytR/AlgR family response regulator
MWIKLPVDFHNTSQEELEQAENLGMSIKEDISEGILYVNTNHVASFNRADDNQTTIEISGNRWLVKLSIEEFKERLKI